jgi:hypothetical protein
MVTSRPVKDGKAAEGADGLTPLDLHTAYNLPTEASTPQTIALVDAFDDPNAESDLNVYSREFGLPACTTENGCFRKLNQRGESASGALPRVEPEWDVEISLDIETAHAICPNCKILLVEAASAENSDLEIAENEAVAAGANEISNSWGGGEPGAGASTEAFHHPGVVITVAAGDDGYDNWLTEPGEEALGSAAGYPASLPDVVAVGGTRLTLNRERHWSGETVWNDGSTVNIGHGAGGSGCSEQFTAPPWQRELPDWSAVGCGEKRAVADVSADADPYSGLAVYDSVPVEEEGEEFTPGWVAIGGTSLASPLIASTFALAGGSHGVDYAASTLYAHRGTAALHEVTGGSNGVCTKEFNDDTGESGCTSSEEAKSCDGELICTAKTGYNGPAGVGTPDGIAAFEPPKPPTVTAVSPDHGSTVGNGTVTVTGEYLAGAQAVDFGSAPATNIDVISATELTASTPAHADGAVAVTVTTAAGSSSSTVSSADEYLYELPPAPSIGSLTPDHGSEAGYSEVVIHGQNLEGASEVRFGGTAARSYTVASDTEIVAQSPAGSEGQARVTVTTPSGTSPEAAGDLYTYEKPPAPTISSVSPSSGPTVGGARVTVSGQNLAGANAVAFGGVAATNIDVVSSSELIVTTPAHAAGAGTVTVTTPSGRSQSSAEVADTYTYEAPVTVVAGSGGSSTLTATPFGGGGSSITGAPTVVAGANSSFTFVSKQVHRRTGAITFTVAVFARGVLHWSVSFHNGLFGVFDGSGASATRCGVGRIRHGGRCLSRLVAFGTGAEAVGAPQIVSFTVSPSRLARRAIAAAARQHRALPVSAAVSYTAVGGEPVAHATALAVLPGGIAAH